MRDLAVVRDQIFEALAPYPVLAAQFEARSFDIITSIGYTAPEQVHVPWHRMQALLEDMDLLGPHSPEVTATWMDMTVEKFKEMVAAHV